MVELLVAFSETAHVDVEVIDCGIRLFVEKMGEFQRVHAANPGAVLVVVLVTGAHTVNDPDGFGFLSVGEFDLASCRPRGVDKLFKFQGRDDIVKFAISVSRDSAGIEGFES